MRHPSLRTRRPFQSVTSTVDTSAEDYEKQFREKLRKVDPHQRVRAFLDHHLEHYQQANGDLAPFLDHLKYAVLHILWRGSAPCLHK